MDIIFEKCNMKAFKILKYCIYKICAWVYYFLFGSQGWVIDKASFFKLD